jgi:hypothetical protein
MPNSTMIYVTHDQVEAMTLATRIVVLANKGIAQVGSPLELYTRPNSEFVAQFIGSPSMNLLPGEIGAHDGQARRRGYGRLGRADGASDMGAKVNVGIRPEDFVETDGADYAYDGRVDYVEALGEVTLLYFEAEHGRPPVLAKLPGIHADVRGRTMRLKADPAKVHIFRTACRFSTAERSPEGRGGGEARKEEPRDDPGRRAAHHDPAPSHSPSRSLIPSARRQIAMAGGPFAKGMGSMIISDRTIATAPASRSASR